MNLADHSMEAFEIHSLRDRLVPGPYDILEPPDGRPWPPEQIDFIVVPALAFSRSGGRLGRARASTTGSSSGRDKTRDAPRALPLAVGLAFDEQVLDDLPMFDHDQRIDILVSDKGLWDFREKRNPTKDA